MVQRYGLLLSHWARNWKQHTTGGWEAFFLGITWRDKVTNEEVRKEQDKYVLRRWSEKKDAMAWSCHENGWSMHSKASTALGSCRIQEKKDELEKCGKEGPPKNGINLGRGWTISSRQTFVASCGLMHLLRWMKSSQVKPTGRTQIKTTAIVFHYELYVAELISGAGFVRHWAGAFHKVPVWS